MTIDPGLISALLVPFAFKLAGAVGLWLAGTWLIRLLLRLLRRSFAKAQLDPTLIGFLLNVLGALLRVVLAVAILGFFGVQTASFAALLAGAGVAIGAAWSGMLANFAAGAFLQLFRPVSQGDFVCAGGVTGTVEEIGMFVSLIESEAVDVDALATELARAAQLLETCRAKIRKAELEVAQIVQRLEPAE